MKSHSDPAASFRHHYDLKENSVKEEISINEGAPVEEERFKSKEFFSAYPELRVEVVKSLVEGDFSLEKAVENLPVTKMTLKGWVCDYTLKAAKPRRVNKEEVQEAKAHLMKIIHHLQGKPLPDEKMKETRKEALEQHPEVKEGVLSLIDKGMSLTAIGIYLAIPHQALQDLRASFEKREELRLKNEDQKEEFITMLNLMREEGKRYREQ